MMSVSVAQDQSTGQVPAVIPGGDVRSGLAGRYLSKLSSNLGGLLVGLVTTGIVPRALGPAHYGDFSFLTGQFQTLINFFDMGGSMAHFTYVSKHHNSARITFLYFVYSIVLGVLLLVGLTVLALLGATNLIWPSQRVRYIYAGTILALLITYAQRLTELSDAKECTVATETIRLVLKPFGLLLLLAMFFSGHLHLHTFFAYNNALFFTLIVAFAWYLKRKQIYDFRWIRLEPREIKESLRYFYQYCHPLFLASMAGFAFLFFDRWFLQWVAGSASQGFYSLSYNLATVCFVFTGAMTPIFMQSLSRAHGENDFTRMRQLFGKIQLFYFIAAFLSVFSYFHVEQLLVLFGGKSYSGAAVPLMIMSFYPVHQTYGQLSSGLLLALEKTDIYRNIDIASTGIGLGLSYFLLAPPNFPIPGLGLGATGLALKMVLRQFIAVNAMLYLNCRILKLSFPKFLLMQGITFAPLLAIGSVVLQLERLWGGGAEIVTVLIRIASFGLLYFFSSVLLCWKFPGLIGLNREEMRSYWERVRSFRALR